MGFIPPPIALTKEQFEKAGNIDIAFENWYRYENKPYGFIIKIFDRINKRKIERVLK